MLFAKPHENNTFRGVLTENLSGEFAVKMVRLWLRWLWRWRSRSCLLPALWPRWRRVGRPRCLMLPGGFAFSRTVVSPDPVGPTSSRAVTRPAGAAVLPDFERSRSRLPATSPLTPWESYPAFCFGFGFEQRPFILESFPATVDYSLVNIARNSSPDCADAVLSFIYAPSWGPAVSGETSASIPVSLEEAQRAITYDTPTMPRASSIP